MTAAHRPALPYVPGIDGLRALSVLAVFLYHAGVDWMPGGFLGVEVFFVISGFLVTSLIVGEWERDGGLDLGSFWKRRARRLVPAALMGVVAVLAYCAAAYPLEVGRLRDDAVASIFAVSNWHQVFGGESYFAALDRPPALRHYWSLAVEWQFYLVWPLAAFGALHFGGRRVLLIVALAGALLSALLMGALFEPAGDPTRIYYGTDTRLSGLLLGSALAVALGMFRLEASGRVGAIALEIAAGGALLSLFAWAATVGEFEAWIYQGGFGAVGLATAVVIAALMHPEGRVLPAVLGVSPLRWLGTRSYSVYLVHWPVIVFSQPHVDVPFDGFSLFLLRAGISVALAEASYRFVEQPFRTRRSPHIWLSGMVREGLSGRLGTAPQAASFFGITGAAVLAVATIWVPGDGGPASAEPPAVHTVVTAVPTSTPTAIDPTATPTVEPTETAAPTIEVPANVTATPTATRVPPTPTNTAEPTPAATEPAPTPRVAVSALGDSVMLGAVPQLGQAFGAIAVDAAVARQVNAGLAVLRSWRDSGTLSAILIVHLGNNGTFASDQFDELMAIAGPDRTVVFVTVKVPRAWEGPNNDVIRAGVSRYPNARLLDWRGAAQGSDGWFAGDGIHLTGAGATAYAALLAASVD